MTINYLIKHRYRLLTSLSSIILLSACGAPSDERLIAEFIQHETRLNDLQAQYCYLSEDPRMRFISVLSRRNIDDRISGHEEEFLAEENNRQVLQALNDELENLGGKRLTILRIPDDQEHVASNNCYIRASLFSRGFINNSVLTGFEYNPPNAYIVDNFDDLPERWGSEEITYRYKLNDQPDDHWYIFFERF